MEQKQQLSMVIDLHKCVGCSSCDIACKRDNNVQHSFAWSNHILETEGTFPYTEYRYLPTLCNHCSNAACVEVCPTGSMYKTEDGITMNDPAKCIGCQLCQEACPYGVIYFNEEEPHADVRQDDKAIIPQCTSTGKEIIEKSGVPLPVYNPGKEATMPGIRPIDVVEKCTFCDHRLVKGDIPACVEACPAGARLFGDLMDSESAPSRALLKHKARVLQPEQGTKPNVFYIRDF